MCTLTSLIEQLRPFQQQAIIDILATIQEQKHLSVKQVGLIGYSIELFPVKELQELFSKNPNLKNSAKRLLAEQGYTDNSIINLKKFLNVVIENEIERRVVEITQKDLFDLAEEEK